jgi:hypothetical protein
MSDPAIEVPDGKPFVGFRVLEIPLGMVRNMVKQRPTPGACQLVEDTKGLSDLVKISVNEFDGGLTIMKDEWGKPLEFDKKV